MNRTLKSWPLFVGAVVIWGTTWHAIVYQLQDTTVEFSVALRFLLAGVLALAWGRWRSPWQRLSARQHARLAIQGVFMHSVSYLCVYHAERFVPSGLVAVGYSASALILGLASRGLWGTALTARFVSGAVLCIVGVGLIFWPELVSSTRHPQAHWGVAFTAAAVLLSAVGSLIASRNNAVGLPFWPSLGWGMVYGSAFSWLLVATGDTPVRWPQTAAWWLSLAYLAVLGSVVAFACYLALQQRWGAAQAGTVGAATPVVALLVSAAFENYSPQLLSVLGAAMALWGNALALGWRWPDRRAAAQRAAGA